MPRQKSLLTVIRDMVRQEVGSVIHSLFGGVSTGTEKPTNGRRRRHRSRGKWRAGGPGRPPKSVAENVAKKATATPPSPKAKNGRRRRRRRRGPAGSKKKAA